MATRLEMERSGGPEAETHVYYEHNVWNERKPQKSTGERVFGFMSSLEK